MVLCIMGYRVCVINYSYSFMENLWLKDILRMYTVLQQALRRGVIHLCLTDTFFFLAVKLC